MSEQDSIAAQWTCFHCGDTFTDEAEACEHFGRDEGKTPACRLSSADVARLRELEQDNAQLRLDNENLENDSRLYHELSAEVERRTKGHGLFMHLDYLEGEKLVLKGCVDLAERRLVTSEECRNGLAQALAKEHEAFLALQRQVSEFIERCEDIRNGSPNAFYMHVDRFCKTALMPSQEPKA